MMKKFEQDECLLMAICQEDTCEQTKEEMKKILPFLKHDTEMTALVKGTLEKMEHLTEEEFSNGFNPVFDRTFGGIRNGYKPVCGISVKKRAGDETDAFPVL